MKALFKVLLGMALLSAGWLPAAQAPALSLSDVLARMDAAAKDFTTAQGNITYTTVTVIVNDKEVQKGQFYFQRLPRRSGGDSRIRINFIEPAAKQLVLKDGKGDIYYPAIKELQEYEIGKNKNLVDQFLLLGFGSSGRDLQQAYTVSLAGDVTVGGEETLKLDLIPKSAGMARSIKSVQLFLSKKTWQPVQQIFTQPSGDYLTAQYDAVKLNAPMSDATFNLKLPKGVKTKHLGN
jgi:outer membrane lipoprotein-sorting protein